MKIKGEYQNHLIANQGKNKQQSKTDFAQFLEKELEESSSSTQAKPVSSITPLNLNLNNLKFNFMQEMDNLLNLWEDYTQKLNSEQANLKEIYGLLSTLKEKVQHLKNSGDYLNQPSPLKDILNELEVLTTTEEIKINRGDYT